VEDNVSVCVAGVFRITLPKDTLVALMFNVGVPVFNCRANVFDTPLALAVSVADCAVLTEETVAVNPTLVALAGTITAAGTATALILLERLTLVPPLGAAALSVTVHASVPDPVIDAVLQERALNTGVGVAAFNCSANVFDTPLVLAVSVADCAVLTEETVAVNPTLVALAGTITAAGTATALTLLERLTLVPPLGAAALSVTVHASVPDPVMDAVLQVRALSTGVLVVPVPLRLTTAVGLVDELLVMASWPVADPATVGSNCTLRVTAWPGFNVTGKAAPDTVNPVPVTVAALTVTAEVPVEVKVTDFVTGVFTATLPNDRLLALTPRVVVTAFSCNAKVLDTPPVLAASVADCAELTEETVAANPTLVAPAGTVTAAGTATALMLLERLTLVPPLGAGPLSVTVHASVPDPVIDAVLQESALSAGVLAVPVPLRLTTAVGLVDELLVMASWPVAEPAIAGSN
jgi:hypothetical protein